MRSLIVDTNILVLLIIGTWDRDSIRRHKRTATFAPADYDLLKSEIGQYPRVMTTQGVLAEASNLMGNDFHGVVAQTLVEVCSPFEEALCSKEEVFTNPAFELFPKAVDGRDNLKRLFVLRRRTRRRRSGLAVSRCRSVFASVTRP